MSDMLALATAETLFSESIKFFYLSPEKKVKLPFLKMSNDSDMNWPKKLIQVGDNPFYRMRRNGVRLKTASLTLALCCYTLFVGAQPVIEKVFRDKMNQDYGEGLPLIVKQITHTFLKTPYVAHTLEGNDPEQLVCRFDGVDCTTLVETVLALAITYQKDRNFGTFKNELTHIRYRGGNIDGYASRLHYFTDWMFENEKRGILKDISQELGGVPLKKKINFMTSNPKFYPSAATEEVWNELRNREDSINARKYFFIPLANIKTVEPKLNDGDIIGIASNIAGLDCNHMGIINKIGNQAYLLHASSVNKEVELSAVPLHLYVALNKKNSGIFVARPAGGQ